MADVIAGVAALILLLAALLLGATLHMHRRRREAVRDTARAHDRTIVAELPAGGDLVIFAEGEGDFHYGDRGIRKADIRAVRVLINGSPIAAYVARRFPDAATATPTSFEDRPDGIARDRWDVAIETAGGPVLVECGAIRERISQELARRIFEAVKRDLEARDAL